MPCPDIDRVLVIPRLRVQNANAISSPLTHGFPAMTAFLGLMWALQRKTAAAGMDLRFHAVGVVCHAHQEQASRDGFVGRFALTRNPVERDGGTAAIVEEGRIHLDISLLFGVQSDRLDIDPSQGEAMAEAVGEILESMRIAGGSVVPNDVSWRRRLPMMLTAEEFPKWKLRLLPGFALVARDDLVPKRLEELRKTNGATNALDAWLSLSRRNWHYDDDKQRWLHDRPRGSGWKVPIPIGYGALTDVQAAGSVTHARDATTPFRFVESLYGMGEWRSPHRLQTVSELLWYAEHPHGRNMYRCRNDYIAPSDPHDHDTDFH